MANAKNCLGDRMIDPVIFRTTPRTEIPRLKDFKLPRDQRFCPKSRLLLELAKSEAKVEILSLVRVHENGESTAAAFVHLTAVHVGRGMIH